MLTALEFRGSAHGQLVLTQHKLRPVLPAGDGDNGAHPNPLREARGARSGDPPTNRPVPLCQSAAASRQRSRRMCPEESPARTAPPLPPAPPGRPGAPSRGTSSRRDIIPGGTIPGDIISGTSSRGASSRGAPSRGGPSRGLPAPGAGSARLLPLCSALERGQTLGQRHGGPGLGGPFAGRCSAGRLRFAPAERLGACPSRLSVRCVCLCALG